MPKDPAERAKEIISKIIYITIATTSKEGLPWNTPVYSAYDEKYNFFWTSSLESVHSKNIVNNQDVFITIYDTSDPEGSGEGIYIQAKAYEMTDPEEIEKALHFFYSRKNKPSKPVSAFLNDSPRRLYKAIPEKIWINTYEKIEGYGIDGRLEIKLS